jgi:hypothetical protein
MTKVTVWPLELVWLTEDKKEADTIFEILGPRTSVSRERTGRGRAKERERSKGRAEGRREGGRDGRTEWEVVR